MAKKKFMKVCFPPIADKNAKVLILGTMPGEESLRKKQYYAHPRNAFWYIVERLLNIDSKVSYEERKSLLKINHIALWDVLMSCEREGSLDSSIHDTSIVANDFALFFSEHPHIKPVYFNGARAEQEYMKRVLPVIADEFKRIEYFRLPSTSPAMARLTKDEKILHWSKIKDKLKQHIFYS
jgi:hypoxanthine-DNA glycosylase